MRLASPLDGLPPTKPMPYELWLIANGPEEFEPCDYCDESGWTWGGLRGTVKTDCPACHGATRFNLTRERYDEQVQFDAENFMGGDDMTTMRSLLQAFAEKCCDNAANIIEGELGHVGELLAERISQPEFVEIHLEEFLADMAADGLDPEAAVVEIMATACAASRHQFVLPDEPEPEPEHECRHERCACGGVSQPVMLGGWFAMRCSRCRLYTISSESHQDALVSWDKSHSALKRRRRAGEEALELLRRHKQTYPPKLGSIWFDKRDALLDRLDGEK